MARTDAEHLESLKSRRDAIEDALAEPETLSAFGGAPDSNGPQSLRRMEARAQLQSELRDIKAEISDLESRIGADGSSEGDVYFRESRGAI